MKSQRIYIKAVKRRERKIKQDQRKKYQKHYKINELCFYSA